MEFVNSDFCAMLAEDPKKALGTLSRTPRDRREKLHALAKRMRDELSISLACRPSSKNDIEKWKNIAKILSSNVSVSEPGDGSSHGDPSYVSQGIMPPHFRTAHIRRIKGVECLILGCLVNEEKYGEMEVKGWRKLLDIYNRRIQDLYSKDRVVMHVSEYLEQYKYSNV